MALFFFLVGLEIKREMLEGNLSSREQIILPAVAAVGGMAVPALIYSLVNLGDPELLRGWAIPAATDIAFALGRFVAGGQPRSGVAQGVPADPGDARRSRRHRHHRAVLYRQACRRCRSSWRRAALAVLFTMNRLHVGRMAPYVFVGLALWVFVLKSGVHATLAGVAWP